MQINHLTKKQHRLIQGYNTTALSFKTLKTYLKEIDYLLASIHSREQVLETLNKERQAYETVLKTIYYELGQRRAQSILAFPIPSFQFKTEAKHLEFTQKFLTQQLNETKNRIRGTEARIDKLNTKLNTYPSKTEINAKLAETITLHNDLVKRIYQSLSIPLEFITDFNEDTKILPIAIAHDEYNGENENE